MYNKTILVGNLTRDIELLYSQAGTAIAKTAIATSRKFTSNGEKKEEVMFIDITFFGRSAEVANQYLRKGSKILAEGRIQFDQWTDQNGGKRSKHSIAVETMQMLDSKPSDTPHSTPAPQHQQPNYNTPQSYGNQPQQQQPTSQLQNDQQQPQDNGQPPEHPGQEQIPF